MAERRRDHVLAQRLQCSDRGGVRPVPASGTMISTTFDSGWTVTRIGSCTSPVRRARTLKSATAAVRSAPWTSGAL